MPRRVRLLVCTGTGQPLGALAPVDVATGWWPDVEPVVDAVHHAHAHGLEVRVLRLLDAEGTSDEMGGCVTYLAEVVGEVPGPVALEPFDAALVGGDDPRRAPYARPGGLAALLAWADHTLAAAGRPRTGPPVQVKTWNLSSVVRLPTAKGPVWCKSVPPFLAHEGAAIALVATGTPGLVPLVLGVDPATGTVLRGDLPGDDQWEAPEGRLVKMVEALVALQSAWASRVDVLLGAGLPDCFADLATCGLPDTLVHGDFHPGNWRWDGPSLVLLDWGDSGVGHPLLDGIEASERRYHEHDVARWIRGAVEHAA